MGEEALKVGEKVVWRYTPRGGYGYVYPVNGVVVCVGKKRVRIRVEKRDGTLVEREVDPANLVAVKPSGPDQAE
jgi:hypothetical protein